MPIMKYYVCVCECALLQKKSTMHSYQISYEDTRTPEYVHLRHGFSHILKFLLFCKFFNDFLLDIYAGYSFILLTTSEEQ